MLTEILMESLMSMDEDTLDSVLESCSAEELEIVNSALEEVGLPMSAKDRDDFGTIIRIQRNAYTNGWGGVPKADRDKFVDILSTSKNIEVLKQAKKLGERQAAHDDRVKRAMDTIGNTVSGSILGASLGTAKGVSDSIGNVQSKLASEFRDIDLGRLKNAKELSPSELKQELNNFTNRLRANGYTDEKIAEIVNKKSDELISKLQAVANSDNSVKDTFKLSKELLNDFGFNMDDIINRTARGAGVGAVTGAGLSFVMNKIKDAERFKRDENDVKMQGDIMHPDKRWKQNRANTYLDDNITDSGMLKKSKDRLINKLKSIKII